MSPLPTIHNVTNPRTFGYGVRLNDDYFRLVTLSPEATSQIQSAPLEAPRIDTGANPEDFRSESGRFFSLTDFSGGEGQLFAHREESSPNRFWDSRHVDVSRRGPGERQAFTLTPATSLLVDAEFRANSTHLATIGTDLFYAKGWEVVVVEDAASDNPAISVEDPWAGEVQQDVTGLAVLGEEVYASASNDGPGNGIHRRDNTGTWSHFSDLGRVHGLWVAKGRLVAAATDDLGSELYEINSDGTTTLLHTLPANEGFTDVTEVGSHILAAATDGQMYAFTFDEETATVALSARTRVSQEGRVTAVAGHPTSALVLYGTSAHDGTGGEFNPRLYRASVTQSGTLSNAQLIREFAGPVGFDEGITVIHASEQHAHIAVIDPDVDNHTVVWRYDFATGGRSRYLEPPSPGISTAVTGIALVRDRLFFAAKQHGLYRQTSNVETSGYLISSLIDHFTASDKTWDGLTVDLDPVTQGRAELYYSTDPEAQKDPDHPLWTRVKDISSGIDTEESVISEQSRHLVLMVKLQGVGETSPSIHAVTSRSHAGPGDTIHDLVVNVSDRIEVPGQRPIPAPRLGDQIYRKLRGLNGRSVFMELLDPYEQLRGQVEGVSARIWVTGDKGSRLRVCRIRVRGREAPETTTASSGSLGTRHLLATSPPLAVAS